MKKIIQLIIMAMVLVTLVACGGDNISEDLQKQKWNVVESTGDSYSAEFGQDTVTFSIFGFMSGRSYEIDGNKIIFTDENGSYEYEIEKNDDEYIFKEKDDIEPIDLTLSPAK